MIIATLLLALVLQEDAQVQDLIRKLGSDDFNTREQATEGLKKIGKPAREALQKAADESQDPEVRQRARQLLEEQAKPAPRRVVPAPAPGRQGPRVGSSVSVRSVNGDTTYTITPGDGSTVLNFYKAAAGAVKLDYLDEKGDAKAVESASLAAFLKDNADLAGRFGISEEGIDYAGSRVNFKGNGMPNFQFPRVPQIPRAPRVPPPAPPPPPPAEEQPEGTPSAGALLGPVDESLRSQLEIPEGQGAVVLKVEPGSTAAALGLKKNDILLEVDGRKIAEPAAAKGRITKESSAVVLRKGKRETLTPKKDY